ncbi:M12 family metallo-peptidase [Granulosicoccus sp. 3-233]|uniref:M12 family metallo-peptidase n=1 Tax=Granulosicoccus sp. 3-233 TaxID=3417969 RepID=UPI003D339721
MPTPPSHARGRGRVYRWVVLGLLLAQTISPVVANDNLAAATPAAVDFNSDTRILSISTIDKQWTLALAPKQLIANSSNLQNAIFGLPQFYDGSVTGDDESWVRITVDDSGDQSLYTGHVFTGGELYELQFRDDMGGHALAPQPDSLMLNDMVMPQAPDTGAENRLPADSHAKLADSTAATVTRSIKIGVTVDSSYNEYHDQRGLAHALSIINGVDGLYREQLGLAVIVAGIRVYDDPAQDPLANYPGDVDQILASYRDVRIQDEQLPADLALVHLFSGHPDPNKTIGLGWIDTVCRLDGYDLSMSTPFPHDMLLSAHEIAHNLGAEHDDGAACSTDESISGNEIMWSELSSSTRPAFSACSLQRMRPALSATCVQDNIDVGVDIGAMASNQSDQLTATITAYNNDSSRVAPQVSSTTLFPGGTQLSAPSAGCSIADNQLTCRHSVLQPGGSNTLSVTARFINDGATYPLVVSELSHGGFTDTQQLDNQATLNLADPQLALSAVTFSDTAAGPTTLPASGDDRLAVQSADDPAPESRGLPQSSGGSAGAGGTGPVSLALMALIGLFAGVQRRRRPVQTQTTDFCHASD